MTRNRLLAFKVNLSRSLHMQVHAVPGSTGTFELAQCSREEQRACSAKQSADVTLNPHVVLQQQQQHLLKLS